MSRPRLRTVDGPTDLPPPHSVEAEQATLGALMIDPEAWAKVAGVLDVTDFYRVEHRQIFDAIAALARSGKPHDVVLVTEELTRAGQLEDCGGLGYLGRLARETPTAAHVGSYAEIVHERAVLRDVQKITASVQRAIADGGRGSEIIASAVAELARIRSAPGEPIPERILSGISLAQMEAHLNEPSLVEGVLSPQTLIAIIGATGSGKTFCAGHLAMCLATGRPWFGREARPGLVVYAALEGPRSAERRFVAARERQEIGSGAPLILTPGPINLRNPADVTALIALVRSAQSDHGSECVAVFVDTVSRALAGGDENGSEDMPALIAGADAVRLQTGAAVVLVHHTGKDESRGARGHSSFKAALDTEIEITVQGDTHVATVTKQRDYVSGERFAFRLPVVELGADPQGKPVTTCVVESVEAPAIAGSKAGGKNQVALRAALHEWHRTHPDGLISTVELRALGKTQRIPRQRFAEVLDSLTRAGYLTPAVGGLRFHSETS